MADWPGELSPCDLALLSAMTTTMSIKMPSKIEKTIEEMPAISPVVNKLTEMARDIDASPLDLVKVIMIDPVLTAKVIRLVNTAFYGLAQRVRSLNEAVILLGVNTVKNLAMYTSILDKVVIHEKKLPLDGGEFWRHCLATAVASKMLAKRQGVPSEKLETYFMAGLLHDLGKVLYLKAVPDIYQVVLTESQCLGVSLCFSEIAHFGFSHADLGGLLARKWILDPMLVEVIEQHHAPDMAHLESHLVKIVIVADNLCKQAQLGQSGNPVMEEGSEDLIGKLNIPEASLQPIVEQLPHELEKASEFLNPGKEVAPS